VVKVLCDSVARMFGQDECNDMTAKKRRRHTPDQIIRKLAEGSKLLAAGQELNAVCRHLNHPGFHAHLLLWEGWHDAKQIHPGDQGQGGPVGSGASR